jgi:type IV pilus assembly protein PilW
MSMRRTSRSPRALHFGRTLIELIIAMAIGLVIMAGVGALYISSSGVSRVANQAGTAQDLGRLAMHVIGESIKVAGYGEIIGSEVDLGRAQTMMDGPVIRGCSGSRFTAPFATPPDYTCTGVAPGDQLLVRFQGSYSAAAGTLNAAQIAAALLPDCLGVSNNNQDTVITGARTGSGSPVRIAENIFALNAAGNTLMCTGNSNPGVPTQLILDVIDFSVFYRFDDDGYNAKVAGDHRWSPLGSSVRSAGFINGLVGPVDPWAHVVGAIVCITIASSEAGTSLQAVNAAASRCPRTAAEAIGGTALTETSTDGRIRRTFMQVFQVRTQGTPVPGVEFL